MADESDGSSESNNLWLVIPAMALLIPILAVAGESESDGFVLAIAGLVVGLVVAGAVAKSLMVLRHKQRMDELGLRLELSQQETARMVEVDRVVEEPVRRPGIS